MKCKKTIIRFDDAGYYTEEIQVEYGLDDAGFYEIKEK